MRYLINTYKILRQILRLKTLLSSQRNYARKLLAMDSAFSETPTYKRAIRYASYIPVFIGHPYTLLRNKKLTTTELELLTLLGAMTALFDDIFDTEPTEHSRLLNLIDNPISSASNSETENMLVEIYNKALKLTPNKLQITDLAKKIHHAQVDSLKQKRADLALSELETITYNKGGYSMQLYRAALNEPFSMIDTKLYFKIGAIGQLENDIFDLHSDLIAGIHTLATQTKSIETLKHNYNHLKEEIFCLLDQLNYSKKQKNLFKLNLKLIIERGNVALNFYERSTNSSSNKFEPHKLSKKQLICDMEKPINILKLIRYAAS